MKRVEVVGDLSRVYQGFINYVRVYQGFMGYKQYRGMFMVVCV